MDQPRVADDLARRRSFQLPASIGDYAFVGDCRSGALISAAGSVDWLCWPHFGSPSMFAAVLDELKGGCFAVHPVGASRTERSYVRDTAVLETRHVTATGELRVTDCMPVLSEALLGYANGVGLFAEELSWKDGSPLGNFPQGFTHLGVVHAILSIARHGERSGGLEGKARPAEEKV